jgi:hypothetical protein
MSTDPFGRALYDHHSGTREEQLIQRDGEMTLEHPIETFYFQEYTEDAKTAAVFDTHLGGPLLDMGAGAGRHSLYFQDQFDTVAIEVSEHLVSVMDERGVDDARLGDMFSLRDQFERDRFGSALAFGTQLGLTGSIAGLRSFLTDLAHITTPDGTAVLDCYDPTSDETSELLGYRHDPAPGLAHRVMWFEYEGDTGDVLHFRLFSPEKLDEATVGTPWEVTDVQYSEGGSAYHYLGVLAKE